MNDIPESVRKKIDELFIAASIDIPMSSEIRHMMTQISFEMYKAGFRDAHRVMRKSLDTTQDMMKGKDWSV